MINPGRLPTPWFIYIGATFNPTVTWTDQYGNPINLTGYTASMYVRNQLGGSVLTTLTTSNGGISIPNPTTGVMNLLLTAAQTAALAPIYGAVFDLQLTSSGSTEIDYLLQGQIVIQQMVTP